MNQGLFPHWCSCEQKSVECRDKDETRLDATFFSGDETETDVEDANN